MTHLQRGDHFQEYNVHEVLRAGGLTAAYRVQTAEQGQTLTLWTLDLSGVSDEDDLPRRLFERFASLKLLDNPYLLPIVDFGQSEDIFYWLTPFARGKLLSAWIEEAFQQPDSAAKQSVPGPAEKDAARLLELITGALAVLWGANLSHGALSPDTVIVTEEGQPLVFQYGINDLFLAAQTGRAPMDEWSLGLANPAYASPEQVLNRAVDWKTDQFALGAMAAALRFGRSPFAAESPVETALRGASPLRWPYQPRLAARMSPTYRRWVARCAALRASDRFPDPIKLVRPLERLAQGKGSRIPLRRGLLPPIPVTPLTRAMHLVGLAVAFLVLGLGIWAGISGAVTLFAGGLHPRFAPSVSMVGPLAPLATPNPTIVAARRISPTATMTKPPSPTPTSTASPTPIQPTATRSAPTSRPTRVPPTATPKSLLPLPVEGQVALWDQSLEPGPVISAETAGQLTETRRLGLGSLNQAAMTSDGQAQAVASSAGVWLQAKEGHTFLDVGDEASAVTFSPEDSLLVVGLRSGDVQVWRWLGGFELAATLKGHTARVESIAFTPDNQRLVTVSADGTARIWLLSEAREERAIAASVKELYALAISQQGKQIATGGRDGVMRIWDIETGEQVMEYSFLEPITALAFNDLESTLVIIGGEKGKLVYWNTFRRQPSSQFYSMRNGITSIDIGPDPDNQTVVRIATADPDMWLYTAALLPDGQGSIRLQEYFPAAKAQNADPWLEDRKVLPTGFTFRADTVFEQGGWGFFSVRWDGNVARDDLKWSLLTQFRLQPITRLAISNNGNWLAADVNRKVALFYTATGNLAFLSSGSLPPGMPFDAANSRILIVDRQSESSALAVLWSSSVQSSNGRVNLGAYSTGAMVRFLDQIRLAVQSNGVQASVTDLANGLPAFMRVSSQDGCQVLGSTGEERPLVYYSPWGLITVNDDKTRAICKLASAWGRFTGAFSPERDLIALTTPKGTIQVISTANSSTIWETGEPVRPAWLLFIPHGNLLMAGLPGNDGARFYDASTGRVVTELNRDQWGRITAAAVSPDGARLYLATQNGIIHQFEVRP